LLEKKLNIKYENNYEVINTGVSGLTLKQNYYTLKEVINYKPDIAIFLIGINDWNGHIYELNDGIYENLIFKISFTKTQFWTTIKKLVIQKNNNNLIQQRYFDGSYLTKQNDSLNRNLKKNNLPKTVSKSFLDYFGKIKALCEKNNIACIISNQPSAYSKETSLNMQKKFWMTPPNRHYTLSLDNLVKISNIYNEWITLQEETKNFYICNLSNKIEPTEINFYDDVHFTEIGALNFSEELFKCIVNKINVNDS
jgi:lysophospholipase L1-like esterase